MTMMARKRSPILRLADDYIREAAAKCIDFVGAATGARPAYIGSYSPDPVTAEAAIPAELVRKVRRTTPEQLFREWPEPLGRNRPVLRGFNSEKEASWTG